MAGYMLVAHQTALSEELLDAARELTTEDPEAEFVVLVPATPVSHMLVWEEGEAVEVARRRAAEARTALEERGMRVVEARSGDADPLLAIDDVLREGQREYAGIVLSTLPPGISRWLKLDVVSRAQRHYPDMRVVHVFGTAPVEMPAAA